MQFLKEHNSQEGEKNIS